MPATRRSSRRTCCTRRRSGRRRTGRRMWRGPSTSRRGSWTRRSAPRRKGWLSWRSSGKTTRPALRRRTCCGLAPMHWSPRWRRRRWSSSSACRTRRQCSAMPTRRSRRLSARRASRSRPAHGTWAPDPAALAVDPPAPASGRSRPHDGSDVVPQGPDLPEGVRRGPGTLHATSGEHSRIRISPGGSIDCNLRPCWPDGARSGAF
mmetsp:Transcript_19378/g.56290  ORF Transcript_19378/g.56290 Transcript_19378/m.56290 type:complete len:205 (+) Transcript_19378:424-1038(+)